MEQEFIGKSGFTRFSLKFASQRLLEVVNGSNDQREPQPDTFGRLFQLFSQTSQFGSSACPRPARYFWLTFPQIPFVTSYCTKTLSTKTFEYQNFEHQYFWLPKPWVPTPLSTITFEYHNIWVFWVDLWYSKVFSCRVASIEVHVISSKSGRNLLLRQKLNNRM